MPVASLEEAVSHVSPATQTSASLHRSARPRCVTAIGFGMIPLHRLVRWVSDEGLA